MKLLKFLPIFFTPLMAISCSKTTRYIYHVHDGDTFTDTYGVKYRLYGVDTPEVSDQYHSFKPTEGIEALYGNEATIEARRLILNHNCEITKITEDPYGRTVAKVSYNGIDLALQLLRTGYARVAYISLNPKNPYFTQDAAYYKLLLDAQYEAYLKGVGVWQRVDKINKIFPKA